VSSEDLVVPWIQGKIAANRTSSGLIGIANCTVFVYTILVKNITLSADNELIEKARSVARAQRRSLNDAFREWLAQFAAGDGEAAAARYRELMKRLRYVNAGRHFTRDELNDR